MPKLLGIVVCYFRGCPMEFISSGYENGRGRHFWRCPRCGHEEFTRVGQEGSWH